MLPQILLEPEQEELLGVLVEASRNVLRENRQRFMAAETMRSPLAELLHPGLPKDFAGAYMGDLQTLATAGLLALSYGSLGTMMFDVTPLGFRYYEQMKQNQGDSTDRIEEAVHHYLDSHDFRARYLAAFDKWMEAEKHLWSGESESELTMIGHLSREAIQLFSTALVDKYLPTGVDPDVTHTVSRLRSVLGSACAASGDDERAFLDALVVYWGTVSDLVQRQEHGAQKENAPLLWQDARRVVFHSMIVMYEIDRALRRNR